MEIKFLNQEQDVNIGQQELLILIIEKFPRGIKPLKLYGITLFISRRIPKYMIEKFRNQEQVKMQLKSLIKKDLVKINSEYKYLLTAKGRTIAKNVRNKYKKTIILEIIKNSINISKQVNSKKKHTSRKFTREMELEWHRRHSLSLPQGWLID